MCSGEVRDPYLFPIWVLVVEPPDPHVDEVVRVRCPRVRSASSCRRRMLVVWGESRQKAPVAADALEMLPDGVYHV